MIALPVVIGDIVEPGVVEANISLCAVGDVLDFRSQPPNLHQLVSNTRIPVTIRICVLLVPPVQLPSSTSRSQRSLFALAVP